MGLSIFSSTAGQVFFTTLTTAGLIWISTDSSSGIFGGENLASSEPTTSASTSSGTLTSKTPLINSLQLDSSYQPWCANIYGVNLKSGMKARAYDVTGTQWGSDLETQFGSDGWMTFCLPSDMPPSRCNAVKSCSIQVSLVADSGGVETNRASLQLVSYDAPVIDSTAVDSSYEPWCSNVYGANLKPGLKAQVFDSTGLRWGADLETQFGSKNWMTFCLPGDVPPSKCNLSGACSLQVQMIDSLGMTSNLALLKIPAAPTGVGSGSGSGTGTTGSGGAPINLGGLNGTFLDLSTFNWQLYQAAAKEGVSVTQKLVDYFDELERLKFDTLVIGATRLGDGNQCASQGEAYRWAPGVEYLGPMFVEAAKRKIKIFVGLTAPAWCGSDWWFSSDHIGSQLTATCDSSTQPFGDTFVRGVMDDNRWAAVTIANNFKRGRAIRRLPSGSLEVNTGADQALASAFASSFGGWYLTPEPPIFAAWRGDSPLYPSSTTQKEFSKYATLVDSVKKCFAGDLTVYAPPLLDIVWQGVGIPLLTPEVAGQWAGLFKRITGVDILAIQDSVGAGGWAQLDSWSFRGPNWSVPGFSKVTTQSLGAYYKAISESVGKSALWADIETFDCCLSVFNPQLGTAYGAAPLSRLVKQLQIASPYVAKKVNFIAQVHLTAALSNGAVGNRLFDAYQAKYNGVGTLLKPDLAAGASFALKPFFDELPGDPLNAVDPAWVVVTKPLDVNLEKRSGLRWVAAHVLKNDWVQVNYPSGFRVDCLDSGVPSKIFAVDLPTPQPNGEYVISNLEPLTNTSCKKLRLSFLGSSGELVATSVSELEIIEPK